MRIRVSACTDKAFSGCVVPMAHLTLGAVYAVNDNPQQPRVRRVVWPV